MVQFGILLLLLTQVTANAQKEFTWKDASHNTRTLSDLQEILQNHRQWAQSGKKLGTRADLSDAYLRGANLGGALLGSANLSRANLSNANLNGAILIRAELSGAELASANLSGASLTYADLSGAYLGGANLNGAYMGGAELAHALLFQADLSSARFNVAKFDGTVFEPNALPQLEGVSRAKNLELLTYKDNPVALVQLRKQFEDGGFREQERKITYALKRREAELSWERCTSRDKRSAWGEDETDLRARAIIWSSDTCLSQFCLFYSEQGIF
jgi:Pentapeptide repeats (8 copies)